MAKLQASTLSYQKESLDKGLGIWMPTLRSIRPRTGWVQSIREGLGMTVRQFAKRLGVSASSAKELEAREVEKNITLATLERAAKALGCRVVYSLVPDPKLAKSFDELRRKQAMMYLQKHLKSVHHSMELEAQGIDIATKNKQMRQRLAESMAKMDSVIWDDKND